MAKKEIRKNEFRKNRTTGHPTYIYAQVGDEYKFIGITHAKITDDIENIPLKKNPNKKDKRTAYVRPFSDRKHKSTFEKRYKGWFFADESDKVLIKQIKKRK